MPNRPLLTPGRLYAHMSAEFQESRSRNCIGCIMPMLCVDEERPQGANWKLEPPLRRCAACAEIARRVFAKYAAIYDVHDPAHA